MADTSVAVDNSPNPMWGGRFTTSGDNILKHINNSLTVDARLVVEDITGSLAHIEMLVQQGIVPNADGARIKGGLEALLIQAQSGTLSLDTDLEDVHMAVEHALGLRIGEAAKRLHTARSRNDQVATDVRLWLRGMGIALDHDLKNLQQILVCLAENHTQTLMPGFTHLQVAQPVSLAHHLLAYAEMLGRDRGRLKDLLYRQNECPLGAAALAGTSYPIDRDYTSQALGFRSPMANSMDAVSARDHLLEFLSFASICGAHLSRLAEELILWSSPAFGFVTLSDAWTTGSSIMPQKKNPDAAELVRGKTGRLFGNLQGLLVVVKGLTLTYSKDLQEDKEFLFDSADTLSLCFKAMTGMLATMTVHAKPMADMAEAGYATATDVADWLVQEHGVAFRDAHHIVGKLVGTAERLCVTLKDIPMSERLAIDPRLGADLSAVLDAGLALNRRTSLGGTAPTQVQQAIQHIRKRYDLD
jgi:argininosuccinate lyase